MAAYHDWNTARKNLVTAIDRYLQTCAALENALTEPNGDISATLGSDDIIAAICERRQSVESKISELQKGTVYLDRIRNRSRRYIPINHLPLEIITRIFALASRAGCFIYSTQARSGTPERETCKTLLVLTSVCSDWRRIAINTHSLWSHIDIHRYMSCGNMIRVPYLWLERARSAPLSVHILIGADRRVITWATLRDLFSRLGAATSLFVGTTEGGGLMNTILSEWLALVEPGKLQTLTIEMPSNSSEGRRLNLVSPVPGQPGQEILKATLTPVRFLRLSSVYFDWDSSAYHSLVELQIVRLEAAEFPRADQMTDILSACPGLRILKLKSMSIRSGPGVAYRLVPLNKLELLEVTEMPPGGLEALFSILAPGPSELSVRFEMTSSLEARQALQSFFGRSNVVRLFIKCLGMNREDVQQHLMPLKNLRILIFDPNLLERGVREEKYEERMKPLLDSADDVHSSRCSSLWPGLRTLYIVLGYLTVDTARRIVESCRITKLRLVSSVPEARKEDFQKELQPVVQDVLCEQFRREVEWSEHMW